MVAIAPLCVGGSLRRALGHEMIAIARTWPVCEVVPESWDPADPDDSAILDALAAVTPVRLHSVSLNPLGDDPPEHVLARVHAWIRRLGADHVSDHFAWTGAGGVRPGVFLPPLERGDLLETRVERLRDRLGVALVLENVAVDGPPEYVTAYHAALVETCSRTATPVLLDLENLRLDARGDVRLASGLMALYGAPVVVSAYHLAGSDVGPTCSLDTHKHRVPPATLALAREALRARPSPVIYERDFRLSARIIADEVSRLRLELGEEHA